MTPVTDPALLAQLNAGTALKPVTDPAILAQLNGQAQQPTIMQSGMRSAINGAMFGALNPVDAAIDATVAVQPGASKAQTWSQRYQENLQHENATSEAQQQAHPAASFVGSMAGGIANPASLELGVPTTLGKAAIQGAGMGATYGAGSDLQNKPTIGKLLLHTGEGAAAGGALGALGYGVGKAVGGGTQSPDAAMLNSNNIPTTIGQDLGGGYKRAEDAFTSMPWGGDAIIARQKEGLAGFNRALEDNALSPVGLKVPAPITPGNDAGKYLKTMNDAAYKAAYTGATVLKSPQLMSDLQSATNHFPAGLDSSSVQQDLQDRVLGAFDQNGVMSSQAFNDAKDWLSEHSRTTQSMSNDQIDIANAYKKALTALKTEMSNTNPNNGAMLKAADAVYARRMPLVDAAGNTNASAKGGMVTPAQFSGALDRSDGSAHGLNYSLGTLPMQDMVQAAQRTLPSSIPDSGTAIRRLLTGGIPTALAAGAGMGAVGIPGLAAASLPIAATRALYSKGGQSLAKAILFGSPRVRAALHPLAQGAVSGLLPGAVSASGQQ